MRVYETDQRGVDRTTLIEENSVSLHDSCKSDVGGAVYVLVDHSSHLLPEIMSKIAEQRPDIVAVETCGGGTYEQKTVAAAAFNDRIKAGKPSDDEFERSYYEAFRDSGIYPIIAYIDVATDDPAYPLVQESKRLRTIFQDAVGRGLPRLMLEKMMQDYHDAFAKSNLAREGIMRDQIARLADQNSGKKLVVVAGKLHDALAGDSDRVVMADDRKSLPPWEILAWHTKRGDTISRQLANRALYSKLFPEADGIVDDQRLVEQALVKYNASSVRDMLR